MKKLIGANLSLSLILVLISLDICIGDGSKVSLQIQKTKFFNRLSELENAHMEFANDLAIIRIKYADNPTEGQKILDQIFGKKEEL